MGFARKYCEESYGPRTRSYLRFPLPILFIHRASFYKIKVTLPRLNNYVTSALTPLLTKGIRAKSTCQSRKLFRVVTKLTQCVQYMIYNHLLLAISLNNFKSLQHSINSRLLSSFCLSLLPIAVPLPMAIGASGLKLRDSQEICSETLTWPALISSEFATLCRRGRSNSHPRPRPSYQLDAFLCSR